MAEARRVAFRSGLTSDQFWTSTPHELAEWCKQLVNEEYKRGAWIAWHVALYSRQKKLPEWDKIVRRFDVKLPTIPQSADTLRAKVLILHAAFGGKNG